MFYLIIFNFWIPINLNVESICQIHVLKSQRMSQSDLKVIQDDPSQRYLKLTPEWSKSKILANWHPIGCHVLIVPEVESDTKTSVLFLFNRVITGCH